MQFYPLLLNTRGLSCLLVGAGEVGCRKLHALLDTEVAEILVLDPAPSPTCEALARDPRVHLERRVFVPSDITGRNLVFVATPDRTVTALVLTTCKAHGILCNSADGPEDNGFIVPATLQRGRITLSLSTQGASPALTRYLREQLEHFLDDRYTGMAELLARLRPMLVQADDNTSAHTALFRQLVRSGLGEALAGKKRDSCVAILQELLPDSLHPRITELLYELC